MARPLPLEDGPSTDVLGDWTGPVATSEISVVICAYTLDRWDDIVRAVSSVLEQAEPVHEVILVSDHNDELCARATAELAGIRVVANQGSRGLSDARNTGIAHATGRVVAFLDDDAAADPTWAASLAAAYTDASVLGVGGLSQADWVEPRPAWFPTEFDWVVGCSYLGLPTRRAPVRNMIGSNMSLRRAVFGAVGEFDARVGRIGNVPVGCEETELCIRATARVAGSRIVYEPMARVRHRVPPGRGTWRYFRSRCLAEGRSKARVARLAGRRSGLASERTYVRRTLPAGFVRGVSDAVRVRRISPLRRSMAIVAGLALTSIGFVQGSIFDREYAAASRPAPAAGGPGR